MEERKSAWEVRRNFGSILRQVSTNRTSIVVESHGEPVAAIVPFAAYQRAVRDQDEMLAILQRAQANAQLSDNEAMELALELEADVTLTSR